MASGGGYADPDTPTHLERFFRRLAYGDERVIGEMEIDGDDEDEDEGTNIVKLAAWVERANSVL